MAVVQLWSAPRCQAGAQPIASLQPLVSDTWTETVDGQATGTLLVAGDVARRVGLAVGQVVRTVSDARGVTEWVVVELADGPHDGAVAVTVAPLRALLGLRGLVRVEGTPPAAPIFGFNGGQATPADVLVTLVLTNLAADGLDWLTLGVVEPLETIDFPAVANVTRGQVLATLEGLTQHRVVLRRLGDTGYALDLLRAPGASLPVVHLSPARGLVAAQRTRDVLRAPTVVVPLDPSGALVDDHAWIVDSLDGDWVRLRDPARPTLWPVRRDGWWVGSHLRLRGSSTTSEVLASRAVDSAVRLASVTGFAAGQQVVFRADASGTPQWQIRDTAAIAARGVVVGRVTTPSVVEASGLLPDPTAQDVSGWTLVGSPIVDQWPPVGAALTGTLVGGYAASDTSVSVTDFPPSAVLRRGQTLAVSLGRLVVTTTTTLDGTGAGTVPVAPAPFGSLLDEPVEAERPPSLGPLTGELVLRVRGPLGSGIHPPTVTVPGSGTVLLTWRLGVTWWSPVAGDTVTVRTFAAALGDAVAATHARVIPDVGGGVGGIVAEDVVRDAIVTAGGTITPQWRGTEFDPAVPATWRQHGWLRYQQVIVSDPADPVPGMVFSLASTAQVQAALDVLEAGDGARYRLRGASLRTWLGALTEPLAIGQRVRLRLPDLGVDATPRVTRLVYSLVSQPDLWSADLAALPPRLTEVEVAL